MTHDRGRVPPILALATRIVKTASRLVPRAMRDDWVQEWSAELWHLHHSLEAQGRLSLYDRTAFVLRSAGSVLDALQLRLGDAQLWSESFAAVASRWTRHPGSVATALLFLSVGIAATSLLLASSRVALEDPRSLWVSVPPETRSWLLAIGIACGVGLIVASAAAADQLLGSPDRRSPGETRPWLVETLLVAGLSASIGFGLATLGVRDISHPQFEEWAASIDQGAVVTRAWMVSWVCGLTALVIFWTGRRKRTESLTT